MVYIHICNICNLIELIFKNEIVAIISRCLPDILQYTIINQERDER